MKSLILLKYANILFFSMILDPTLRVPICILALSQWQISIEFTQHLIISKWVSLCGSAERMKKNGGMKTFDGVSLVSLSFFTLLNNFVFSYLVESSTCQHVAAFHRPDQEAATLSLFLLNIVLRIFWLIISKLRQRIRGVRQHIISKYVIKIAR